MNLLNLETNSLIIKNVIPRDEDLVKLRKFQEKIEKIQQCAYKYVGINFVTDAKEKAVPVYITKNFSGNEFQIHELETDKMLGWARVSTYQSEDDEDYGFYPHGEKKVTLEMLKNVSEEGHKHVGSLLMKAILQTFLKDCEARMELTAVRKAHPFHYRMGLRSKDAEENRLYASYLGQKKESIEEDFGSVPMYLPNETRDLWIQEIKAHPIDLYS